MKKKNKDKVEDKNIKNVNLEDSIKIANRKGLSSDIEHLIIELAKMIERLDEMTTCSVSDLDAINDLRWDISETEGDIEDLERALVE